MIFAGKYSKICPRGHINYPSNFVNPIPSNTFLDVTKLKVFADYKINVAKMTIFLCDIAENAVEKGENASYQHFLLFLQCFPKPPSLGSLKVRIVW